MVYLSMADGDAVGPKATSSVK